jgi:hypothetical protein
MKNIERLDERFRQWAAAQQSDDASLRRITSRIVHEACRRRRLAKAPDLTVLSVRWPLAAVATAILVLLTVAPWRTRAPDAADVLGRISEPDVAVDRRLFGEMHRLFGQRLRWVAEFNGDVSVGVDELPGKPDAGASPMSLRLVVVARDIGDATWRPVWSGDVLMRSDERVQIVAGDGDTNVLTFWAYAVGEGAVAVEADVNLNAPVRMASRVDNVFADGVPAIVACLRSGGREYRMLHTVKVL